YSSDPCYAANTDTCGRSNQPITGSSMIQGRCGSCAIVNIDLPCEIKLPSASIGCKASALILDLDGCSTTITGLCDTSICDLSVNYRTDMALDFDVKLNCQAPRREDKT